jgi:hypothetical protein
MIPIFRRLILFICILERKHHISEMYDPYMCSIFKFLCVGRALNGQREEALSTLGLGVRHGSREFHSIGKYVEYAIGKHGLATLISGNSCLRTYVTSLQTTTDDLELTEPVAAVHILCRPYVAQATGPLHGAN